MLALARLAASVPGGLGVLLGEEADRERRLDGK